MKPLFHRSGRTPELVAADPMRGFVLGIQEKR
jgi:hypothetical protein